MISATQLRPGMVVKWNGELFSIFKMEHRTPGNLRGFVQVKMRKFSSGTMMAQVDLLTDEQVERMMTRAVPLPQASPPGRSHCRRVLARHHST